MKAIILAAGKGTRLNKYTKDLPKGMLKVFDKSIIQYQVDCYRRNEIDDITIITGYKSDKINIKNVKTVKNEKFADTNMVESLFCAESEICGEVIISYADILIEDRVLQEIINSNTDIGVLVDKKWQNYWFARYGKIDFDTESLKIQDGNIVELGVESPSLEEIDGRYVGVVKLSKKGSEIFNTIYTQLKNEFSGKYCINNRIFEKIYMTDFIQILLNKNYRIHPIIIENGWLEFDTNEDYEKILELYREDALHDFFVPNFQEKNK